MLVVTLLSACSGDDYSESVEVPSADGTYSYTLHMDCQIADSMGEGTRASMSLTSGTTIYLRFYNNGGYTSGTAVYNSTGQWTFTTSNSLPTITTGMTCEAYYFKNPGTVYTSSINLTENTACYQGSGNYSHPTASDVFVSVSLKPKNWRLRFYGRASGTITILGSSSDISYYTSFNRNTGEFSSTKKDVSLSISNGSYSSYIYGFFPTPSSSNSITVKTNSDDNLFTRTINGNTLHLKGSGWLYAPAATNYTGWTVKEEIISNCDTRVYNPLPFTNCIVTKWSVGSKVNSCYAKVFTQSEISGLSDASIISKIMSSNTSKLSYSELYSYPVKLVRNGYSLSSDTYYTLCTISYSSLSKRGNLVKYNFKTNSTSLARANVSNCYYSGGKWHWTTTSYNGATRYKTFVYFLYADTEFVPEKEAYTSYFQTQSDWQSRFTTWSFTVTSEYSIYPRIAIFTWPVTSAGKPYGNLSYVIAAK